jgi:DNA-binding CsgD family transcriptional regulator
MSHLVLLTYLAAVCCGAILAGLARHMSRAYRHPHLRLYAAHLIFLDVMALSLLALRYIQVNLSPAKEGIVGGLHVLFMAISAVDFAAIVGFVTAFALLTSRLGERRPAGWLKAAGWLAVGGAAAVWAMGVFDVVSGRSADVLMVSLRVLDYLPKALILVLSLVILAQSRRTPPSGLRIALRGLAVLYASVHLAFFAAYALRTAWPSLFALAWPAYFLALGLVPLLAPGTFLHSYHGKKLYAAGRAAGIETVLESRGVTRREREVIELVCTGRTNREIEGLLYVSEKTVKFHLYNAYRKLGLRNRVELVNLVQDLRAVGPPPAQPPSGSPPISPDTARRRTGRSSSASPSSPAGRRRGAM